jgi:hypothetical protein
VRGLHARKNGSLCMIITIEFETTWQGWIIMKSSKICLFQK